MYVSSATYLVGRVATSRAFIGLACFLAGAMAAIAIPLVADAATSVVDGVRWLGQLWVIGD